MESSDSALPVLPRYLVSIDASPLKISSGCGKWGLFSGGVFSPDFAKEFWSVIFNMAADSTKILAVAVNCVWVSGICPRLGLVAVDADDFVYPITRDISVVGCCGEGINNFLPNALLKIIE